MSDVEEAAAQERTATAESPTMRLLKRALASRLLCRPPYLVQVADGRLHIHDGARVLVFGLGDLPTVTLLPGFFGATVVLAPTHGEPAQLSGLHGSSATWILELLQAVPRLSAVLEAEARLSHALEADEYYRTSQLETWLQATKVFRGPAGVLLELELPAADDVAALGRFCKCASGMTSPSNGWPGATGAS